MAKKKASKKTKPNTALPPAGDIPEGFQQVGGGYAPTWNVEAQPILQGVVSGEVRDVEIKRGRSVNRTRTMEVTEDNTGLKYTVWQSATLEVFFDEIAEDGVGTQVFIRYDGLGKKKGKNNPPKLFTAAKAA